MNLAGDIILCVFNMLQPERRGVMLDRSKAEAVMHGRADNKEERSRGEVGGRVCTRVMEG